MADFSSFDAKTKASYQAIAFVSGIRACYTQMASLRAQMQAYQTNTDPVLVAAVNALLTQAQRQEVASVVQALSSVATDLETNHASLIGK